jgi:lysophospholipase L1-like esterase
VSGLNATLQRGTATWPAGKFGTALNGATYVPPLSADSFLSVTGSNGGALGTGTIEAWVNTSSASGARVAVGHDQWYWLGLVAGVPTFRYGSAAGTELALNGSVSIANGAWHHIAAVLVNGAGSLYVDGTRLATSATAKSTGTSALGTAGIGGFDTNASGSGTDWIGSIDEVRWSTTALYAGATYTTPSAAFANTDATTAAIYHLDGDGTDSNAPAIQPTNANIIYSPYNWDVTSVRAQTVNPGAYFRAQITGTPTAITLLFDLTGISSPTPQIKYRIDDGAWILTTLASSITVAIPATNTWTSHRLEVVVKSAPETVNRWTSPQSSVVRFLGIALLPVAGVGAATIRPRGLNVLAYGDSITEGVRTLNMTAGNTTDRNDSTLSWAHLLGDTLGAEVGVVGFGAQGVTNPGNGNVPAMSTSYNLLFQGVARVFTPAPDLIVINQGTNDAGTSVPVATFKTALTALVNNLLAATPTATLIAVMLPFNAAYGLAAFQAAAALCATPKRVTVIDTTGWWASADSSDALHPYGYTSVSQLAPRTAAALRAQLNRGGTYVNVGGVAKNVSPKRV